MRHPAHPWIEVEPGPIYVMTLPSGATDDEVRELAAAREAWVPHARRHAWVVDLSNLRWVPATQRQIFAEHLKRFEPCDLEFNAGSGIVVPNPAVRGIMTAVFWLAPPEYPNRAFQTVAEARGWCQAQLDAHA